MRGVCVTFVARRKEVPYYFIMCMTPTQAATIDRMIEALQAMKAEIASGDPQVSGGYDHDIELMAKAAAAFDSRLWWAGIAGNAWLDRDRENVKRQWFVDNVELKKKALAAGEIKTLGGLWVDHEPTQKIGTTMFEAVPEERQVYIAAGPIGPTIGKALMGKRWPMSTHFLPAQDREGIVVFENSVVWQKIERNPLTALRVYQRESA